MRRCFDTPYCASAGYLRRDHTTGESVMKYSSILSIAAVVMIWPVAATAAPPQLKGTYAVTGTVQCLNSNLPFNANFTPATGSLVQSNRATFVGTKTFDGNGSGQMTVRSVGMNLCTAPGSLDTSLS